MGSHSPAHRVFQFCPNCKHADIQTSNGHHYQCPACKFEYFHNTAAAVAAIICYQDEILFTVRAKAPMLGKLDLPGGFVDHNESLEHALSREIQEELGLAIDQWQYFYSGSNTYEYKGLTYFTCDAVFVTTLTHKPNITIEESEITAYKWIKKNEIKPEEIGFISLRQAVTRFLP